MSYIDNGIFSGSFRGNQHYLPIVGSFENQQRDGVKIIQANLTIPAPAGLFGIGQPVVLSNATVQDPHVPTITGIPASDATIAGFILRSVTDIAFAGNTAPMCIEGYAYSVALIGSGVETYLPCNNSLANVPLTSGVTWDFATRQLKVSAQASLPIRILTAPVIGIVVDYSVATPTYKQDLVIKVQL